MSFLFGSKQPSSAERMAAVEAEMEATTDVFRRLIDTCTQKCIPKDFHEGELNKGESVCLDRCVSKFLEATIKANEKVKNQAASGNASGGGGGGGGGGSMFGL